MDLEIAYRYARQKMNEFGLTGWNLMYDKAKIRMGVCYYKRKLITLSAALVGLNSEAELKDTVLHEIAHALVGAGHGHGQTWKEKFKSIGGSGQTYYDESVVPTISKYIAVCGVCQKQFKKYRLKRRRTYWCACGGRGFTKERELKYRRVKSETSNLQSV